MSLPGDRGISIALAIRSFDPTKDATSDSAEYKWIGRVDEVRKLTWSDVRSFVFVQRRQGKEISIARDLLSPSLSTRLIAIHSLEGFLSRSLSVRLRDFYRAHYPFAVIPAIRWL